MIGGTDNRDLDPKLRLREVLNCFIVRAIFLDAHIFIMASPDAKYSWIDK